MEDTTRFNPCMTVFNLIEDGSNRGREKLNSQHAVATGAVVAVVGEAATAYELWWTLYPFVEDDDDKVGRDTIADGGDDDDDDGDGDDDDDDDDGQGAGEVEDVEPVRLDASATGGVRPQPQMRRGCRASLPGLPDNPSTWSAAGELQPGKP